MIKRSRKIYDLRMRLVRFFNPLAEKCSLENYSNYCGPHFLWFTLSEKSVLFSKINIHLNRRDKHLKILQTLLISDSKVNREVSLGNFGSIIFKESSALRVHNLSPLRISYLDRFLKNFKWLKCDIRRNFSGWK